MKNRFKYLLLAPTLLLSACGYGLKEIYPGTVYISVDYYENFYREWNKEINYHQDGNKVENIAQEPYILDEELDHVFTKFGEENFAYNQPDYEKYSYTSDIYEPPEGKLSYGQTFALNKSEPSLKYGYTSKLFNGQMFCNMKYEIARVQIDESGFGMKFNKEIDHYTYFALNFKASIDYRRDGVSTNIPAHNSKINMLVNFYCKTDSQKLHRIPVSYQIDNVKTNMSETFDGSNYVFFGFDLTNVKIDRCVGISIEYELLEDEYIKAHPDEGWTHCLLLYELFLPNSTWH